MSFCLAGYILYYTIFLQVLYLQTTLLPATIHNLSAILVNDERLSLVISYKYYLFGLLIKPGRHRNYLCNVIANFGY